MQRICLLLVSSLIIVCLNKIFLSDVFAADSSAPPAAVSLDPASPSPTTSPSNDASITPLPTDTTSQNPTPTQESIVTPTSIPTNAPAPHINTTTSEKKSSAQHPTATPTPRPTATPTPKPKAVAQIKKTPPTPPIKQSFIPFPQALASSYTPSEDAYRGGTLSVEDTLKLLTIGSALLVLGMIVLRWREGDVIAKDVRNIGLVLRSWLL